MSIRFSAVMISALTLFGSTQSRADSALPRPVPEKVNLPITPDSFCKGVKHVLEVTKQDLREEFEVLCAGEQSTSTFERLFSRPYDGRGDVNYTPLQAGPAASNPGFVQMKVLYSMRVKKSAVDLLLSEEGLMSNSYTNPDLSLSTRFTDPPENKGDCDTAFSIVQRTKREQGQRRFDDTSNHTLCLYRMNPNNFDFLSAARTLNAPTSVFKKSTILRASLTDPNDANYSISVTVMNLLISDQNNNDDRVEAIFERYIKQDIQNVYKYHVKNKR